jgi:hypothetical protein
LATVPCGKAMSKRCQLWQQLRLRRTKRYV